TSYRETPRVRGKNIHTRACVVAGTGKHSRLSPALSSSLRSCSEVAPHGGHGGRSRSAPVSPHHASAARAQRRLLLACAGDQRAVHTLAAVLCKYVFVSVPALSTCTLLMARTQFQLELVVRSDHTKIGVVIYSVCLIGHRD
uniref:Uncharacterized protein n=1 Tax=Aegilops tauschii subsp. strangulata TaxID=200361 RepID=A0A452Z6I0_AEGTS